MIITLSSKYQKSCDFKRCYCMTTPPVPTSFLTKGDMQ